MEPTSPPRKKLKQARLPFQILSPKESSADTSVPVPSGTRKRQLSEESKEDAVASKVKKSEEFKENETIHSPPKVTDGTVTDAINGDELEKEVSPENESDSPNDNNSARPQEGGNILQGMKSNLANLFERKSFDVTADVGSCDCGCEEADSEDEAMKEYFEHNKKGKDESSEKKPKGRVHKKSAAKSKSGQQSLQKKSRHSSEKSAAKSKSGPQSPKKTSHHASSAKSTTDGESSSVPETEKNEMKNGIEKAIPETSSEAKSSPLEKSGLLSRKAITMFAKWRKADENKEEEKEVKTEKSEEAVVEQETMSRENIENQNIALDQAESNKEKDQKDLKIESNASECESASNNKDKKISEKAGSPPKKRLKEDGKSGATNSSNDSKSLTDLMLPSADGGSSSKLSHLTGSEVSVESPIVIELDKTPCPLTPTNINKTPQRQLTPKQLERQKEVARKQEEKEKQKLEKELEKKRLKLEKDEMKKKEKEDKEEQRRKEKEEKEKKRLAEQEQKNEEKKKKELLKAEEKRRKDEEKRKMDEDKKKAEEEEERKKAKASAMFTSFFVPKSTKSERDEAPQPISTVQNFMPFEVKADMRMAPQIRLNLSSTQKKFLDETIGSDCSKPLKELYIQNLKSGQIIPKFGKKTWPVEETKEDDDVLVLESDDSGILISVNKKAEKMRAKFLQFCENHRPAYRGTWRKKSIIVTGRRPFGQEKILDYEVDSADEWEEEEPGESLHGSDDEKEQESEDEYEVDNSIFVPHGYLSDDEGDDEENEEVLSPETQKAKLKLLGEEFEAQMRSKTSALKPMIIVLTAALQASSLGSTRYQKLFERRAVWREDEGPIVLSQIGSDSENVDGQLFLNSESNCAPFGSGPGAKKKIISEEALPALITLIHGNQNRRLFLTNEFSAFLGKSQSIQAENSKDNADLADRPGTPSSSAPNAMAVKWAGLPPASRISISNKIKELATWGLCPEEGPMYNRQCWYVAEEVREKYGIKDLKLPNTVWHYTLKPKVFNHINSPNANAHSVTTSSTDSRALITKFTKVMTPEEKQRQWESMKSASSNTPSSKLVSSKGSAGKITAFTQPVITPSSSTSDRKQISPAVLQTGGSNTPKSSHLQAKKRVPLLVSVPRGHQIISSSHCSLLSKFEASASSKSSVVIPNTNTTKSKDDNKDCIILE